MVAFNFLLVFYCDLKCSWKRSRVRGGQIQQDCSAKKKMMKNIAGYLPSRFRCTLKLLKITTGTVEAY